MENSKKNKKTGSGYKSKKKRKTQKENVWKMEKSIYESKSFDTSKFVNYYKHQELVPEEEFDQFIEALRKDLPMTLRITSSTKTEKEMLKHLMKNSFKITQNANPETQNNQSDQNHDDQVIQNNDQQKEPLDLSPQVIPWYPEQDIAWKVNANNRELKKNEKFVKLRQFIVHQTDLVKKKT